MKQTSNCDTFLYVSKTRINPSCDSLIVWLSMKQKLHQTNYIVIYANRTFTRHPIFRRRCVCNFNERLTMRGSFYHFQRVLGLLQSTTKEWARIHGRFTIIQTIAILNIINVSKLSFSIWYVTSWPNTEIVFFSNSLVQLFHVS